MNILFSFDFIYQAQNLKTFLPDACELNFTSIEGVHGYCDDVSANLLRKKLLPLSPDGLHFLGSGSYHYLSLFFLEKLMAPFSLLVFDHHTDMQPSIFGNLLSCGSWILHALETVSKLKEVLIIGVGEESLQGTKETSLATENFSISKETQQLLQCQHHRSYGETVPITILKEASHYGNWEEWYQKYLHYPVFLSIDKDVLSKEELKTDWDQGTMSKQELKHACEILLSQFPIMGIDICGEGQETDDISQSLKINQDLIRIFLRNY